MGGRADKFYIYSINQMKLMSVLEIKGLSKVKTIGSAIGMPEHIFYLGDSQVKLLNLTDARIEVRNLRAEYLSQNTLGAIRCL